MPGRFEERLAQNMVARDEVKGQPDHVGPYKSQFFQSHCNTFIFFNSEGWDITEEFEEERKMI